MKPRGTRGEKVQERVEYARKDGIKGEKKRRRLSIRGGIELTCEGKKRDEKRERRREKGRRGLRRRAGRKPWGVNEISVMRRRGIG